MNDFDKNMEKIFDVTPAKVEEVTVKKQMPLQVHY